MTDQDKKINVDSIIKGLQDSLNLAYSKNILGDSIEEQYAQIFNAQKNALILHSLNLIRVDTSDKKSLSENGMIKYQPDGTHEFHWKDRMLCSIRLDISSGKYFINLPNWILANPEFIEK